MIKKGMMALAVLLFLVHSAHAGPNAAAVPALDLTGGNSTDDGVTSATGIAAGASVTVEIFASGIASTLSGVDLQWTVDQAQASIPSAGGYVGPFSLPIVLPTSVSAASITGPVTIDAAGYLGVVTFTIQEGVTADTEFSITLTSITVADATGAQDVLSLEGVTSTLTFNQAPPAPVLGEGPADPVTGNSTDLTITNLAGGESIVYTITVTGGSAAAVSVAGQSGTATAGSPLTVTISSASAGSESITLEGSGGNSTVSIAATVDGADAGTASVVFSQLSPAELAFFGGEIVEEAIVLDWTTVSQTNNAGWRVFRSEDGVTYAPVSELIPGAGTTDAVLPYQFTDETVPAVELVYYRLEQVDLDGRITQTSPIEVILGARFLDLPSDFATSIYPNPFNPSTTVAYDLPSEASVSIVIYDALGQEVRRLVSDTKSAGRYTIQWDARDNLGRGVGSGVYIAKVEAGAFSATQKMLLLK